LSHGFITPDDPLLWVQYDDHVWDSVKDLFPIVHFVNYSTFFFQRHVNE